jgi:hypothetical protein
MGWRSIPTRLPTMAGTGLCESPVVVLSYVPESLLPLPLPYDAPSLPLRPPQLVDETPLVAKALDDVVVVPEELPEAGADPFVVVAVLALSVAAAAPAVG